MQIMAPDILELTRQLSPALTAALALIGFILWGFGARTHRFWLALVLTVAGGIVGLTLGRDYGVQPLVAGLLAALSAGALSLSLARISLFVLGGLAGVLLARLVYPTANELIGFLVGGLAGVCLYQLWLTSVSSIAGTVLMSYGAVSLLDKLGRMDSVTWANQNTPLINWGLIVLVLAGVVVQFLLEARRNRLAAKKAEKQKEEEKKDPHAQKKDSKRKGSDEKGATTPWSKLAGLFGKKAA